MRHQTRIDGITNKIKPEKIVVCEINLNVKNEEASSRVELYNDYLSDTYSTKPGFELLRLNAMTRNVTKWSFLQCDNIHHDNGIGEPFLRNCKHMFKESATIKIVEIKTVALKKVR